MAGHRLELCSGSGGSGLLEHHQQVSQSEIRMVLMFSVAMGDCLLGRMSVVGDDVTVMATCVAACVVRTDARR